MLCRSTLAENREGTLSPSRFGVWTSSVPPIKGFTMNRRMWWHGGLTLPWETAQSRSIPKDVASHFLQWTCVKEISCQSNLAGFWSRFGNDTFIIFYIKGPSLRGSFISYSIPQYLCCFRNIIRVVRFDLIQFWPHGMYFLHKFYHCNVIGTEKKG